MDRGQAEPYPVQIELRRGACLWIAWDDGVESEIALDVLRRNCPCATCQAARRVGGGASDAAGQPLGRQTAVARTAELVGRYALRISWEDGHDAGIYDFGLLRRLGGRAGGRQGR